MILQDTATLAQGEEKLVTVVWNGDEGIVSMYIDGLLISEGDIHFDLTELIDDNNWLGRSQWPDTMYVGSYDEFRLYNFALNDGQVYGNFLAGPDTVQIGGLAGDYNDDGELTVADLDLQTQAIQDNGPLETFDENGDGLVNSADRYIWVEQYKNTWVGDADLDGVFGSGDLVTVLSSGTYEQDVDSSWSTGDFNGDRRTNTGDLVDALAGGGYEQGPRNAAQAVPEPAGLTLLLLGFLSIVPRRRAQR